MIREKSGLSQSLSLRDRSCSWLCAGAFLSFWIFQLAWIPSFAQSYPYADSAKTTAFIKPLEDRSFPSFFTSDNPDNRTVLSDTTLEGVTQFDPVRKKKWSQAHLGTMGSAHWPIVYQPENRRGFDLGWRQFDLYRINPDSFKFYQLDYAWSEIAYNQGSEQEDAQIQALFSRNFGPQTNFTIQYNRLLYIPLGASKFVNQRARNVAFATGIWYQNPATNYRAGLSFTRNSIEQKDNGGTLNDSYFQPDLFQNEISVPVFLSDAQTRFVTNTLNVHQYLPLFQKPDSTTTPSNNFFLHHHLQYEQGVYKFFDQLNGSPESGVSTTDSIFYRQLLIDPRGLRQQTKWNSLENTFSLNWKTANAFDFVAGLSHKRISLQIEDTQTTINNLFITGKTSLKITNALAVNGYGHLGVLDNAGDYKVKGEISARNSFFTLRATLTQELFGPDFIKQEMRINRRLVWNNEFRSTAATRAAVTCSFPALNLSLSGNYHRIENLIIFDQTGLPAQLNNTVNVLQLFLQNQFKVGPLRNENLLAFQYTPQNDALPLPKLYTQNSLFLEGYVFDRAMLSRLGIHLRLTSSFMPYQYQPLTGTFFIQDGFETGFFPAADAFITVKVSDFRFFFRYDNLTTSLLGQRFYQTTNHPYLNAYMRFGFRWILRN